MAESNGIIAHYNFSWPLSMDRVPLKNTPLSESAAILQKAHDLKKLTLENNKTKDDEYLDVFRSELYDQQLTQLKSELSDRNILMFGLTELSVRDRPEKSGHAVFTDETLKGTGMSENIITPDENYDKFGIGKMLNILSDQVTDRSILSDQVTDRSKSAVVPEKTEKKYDIMYDNIIHKDWGYGEGIGLIIKSDLVDKYFTWESNSRGFIKKKPTVKVGKQDNLNFWSSDCGYSTEGMGLYKTDDANKKDLDLGRPFIMTAGMKDNVLRIFVNFHGINILNLFTDIKENGKRKQLKALSENNTEAYAGAINSVKESITKLIDEGLGHISTPIPSNKVTECQLFLTCDSNDAKNDVFKDVIENGITLQNLPKLHKTIRFPYDPNHTVHACCANADSIQNGNKNINTLGKFHEREFDNGIIKSEINKTYDTSIKYPDSGFTNPENYEYSGDKALFGTSFTLPKKEDGKAIKHSMKIEETKFCYNNDKNIPLSDHQYVTTTIPMMLYDRTGRLKQLTEPTSAGGTRRTKKRTRHNRKTNRRKSSRRNRRRNRRSRKTSRR